MATEFRKKKCRHVFSTFLDLNKDGSIDKDDMDFLLNKLSKLKQWKPDGPEIQNARKELYTILDGMLVEMDANHDGKISFEEFAILFDKYAKNPTKPSEWHILYEDFVYRVCLSCSKIGVITKEEYVKLLLFFGITKENAEVAFKAISRGKDTIKREDFKIIWREYFLSDDPNAPGNHLAGF